MNIESKLRPLYLAKILLSQTDDEHSLTTNELSEILEREYHISAHRTTIGEDIKVLAQAGLDVDTIKSTQNKFRILSRDFDIAELKLLIDAVESSMFITEKRSDTLIEKLQRQATEMLDRPTGVIIHRSPAWFKVDGGQKTSTRRDRQVDGAEMATRTGTPRPANASRAFRVRLPRRRRTPTTGRTGRVTSSTSST